MKPAAAQKKLLQNQNPRITEMRARLARWRSELIEDHRPLQPYRSDGTQLVLNNALWDAFCKKDKDGMLRLAKAGADPHSIGRRIDREERGFQF